MTGHNLLRFVRSFLAMNFDDLKYYLQGTVWEKHQNEFLLADGQSAITGCVRSITELG